MSTPADESTICADVAAAAGGDGAAYGRIIARFQPVLARRMRRFVRGAAEIEEGVHDVFVEAYFALGSFRGDAPFEHWLQRIATRVGYRLWKRTKNRAVTTSLPESVADRMSHSDATDLTPTEADEALSAVLDRLPPRDRLVITLMYIEGRSVADTAGQTGWSQTMVKVQAHRARAKLRKLMGTDTDRGRVKEVLP